MIAQEKKVYNQILALIHDSKSVLIVSHEDPDGDSIGSQLALRRFIVGLKKNIVVVNRGGIPVKYRFLPDIERIEDSSRYKGDTKFDLAIILECPSIDRTGEVFGMIPEGVRLVNIDHHPDNVGFGTINLLQSKSSSVGEMLYEFLSAVDATIDRETATLLYAAILTDTGRFRYRSTSRRTMEIAGRLIELGADPRDICDRIYYCMPESTLKLTAAVLSGIQFFEKGRICLLRLNRKMLENSNGNLTEADGLTDYTLYSNAVVVGGLLKEIDDKRTKVSLRSRNDIDVSKLAHKYGGGGHFNAAGFELELPLDGAWIVVLADLKEIVNGKL